MRYKAQLMILLLSALSAGSCGDPGDGGCPGLQRAWYRDADGDGYSDNVKACALIRPGVDYYISRQLSGPEADCDDADPAVHPGVQEACNDGKDNDCDGIADNCPNPQASVWKPAPGTSWQWQLTGQVDTGIDVAMYDIDLFDSTKSLIDQLHQDGRTVICYFSAGSWENWRPDAGAFPASVKGWGLAGWHGERWLDIRRLDVLGPLMGARLDMAVEKGCDGVEPDNVDGYINLSGFPLTAADQLRFNIWLAEQAHARGLSVGLKNDVGQIQELVGYFDWALNEQCFENDECDALLPFVSAGKAVFGVMYDTEPAEFCAEANAMNFDFLKKNRDLDAYRFPCR